MTRLIRLRRSDSAPTSSSLGAPLISTFRPSFQSPGSTMPSADFCVLTGYVSTVGAPGMLMRCYLLCVSLKGDAHLPTADGCAGSLVNRIDLVRILLMNFLSPDTQISPDKNVNFLCTTAAFTLSPEPTDFVVPTRPETEPCMRFLFPGSSPGQDPARTFALRLPSDPSSRRRPCLRLVLVIASISMNTLRFSYKGLSPHKLTPMPGVHMEVERAAPQAGFAFDVRRERRHR